MNFLNISEIRHNSDDILYKANLFPYSLSEVRMATLCYLQNKCEAIVAIGNRWLLDFATVTALLCGNNAAWSRLLFDETVSQNHVPITYSPVDFLGFLNKRNIAVVDYCDMDVKVMIGNAYKEIPKIANENYIMSENKNKRLLYLLEAIEKGILSIGESTLVLGQQYVEGHFKAFEKLIKTIDRDKEIEKGYISDFISFLMPYGNNSYYDWYHFFIDEIFSDGKYNQVRKLLQLLNKQNNLQLVERKALIDNREKIIYLFKRNNGSVSKDNLNYLINKVLED